MLFRVGNGSRAALKRAAREQRGTAKEQGGASKEQEKVAKE